MRTGLANGGNFDLQPADNRSFFADCERDEKGHCVGEGGGGGIAASVTTVSVAELKAARVTARNKAEAAPVPTPAEVNAAHARIDRVGADRYEADIRGNTADRASSRARLLKEFGDGKHCPCVYCGEKLNDATVTRDKIYTAREGGRYKQANLVPSCIDCNKQRGDVPFKDIKWGKV